MSDSDQSSTPPAPAAEPSAPAAPPHPPVARTQSIQSGSEVASETETKRPAREKLNLCPEDEEKVAQWYQDNDVFYNKHHRGYKDTRKKDQMLEEMARTLETPCTGKQLKTWLESMRTQFGRLIRAGPSGSAKLNPTEKEAWVLRSFRCVEPFIRRTGGKSSSQVGRLLVFFTCFYCIFVCLKI